jgi:hypothetical protein
MTRFALRFRFLLLLALAGCSGVQIIPEPFVMPDQATRRFQVHANVANFNTTDSAYILWVQLHAEYWPVALPAAGQLPCLFDSIETVGFLKAGASFKLGPEDISGHQPGILAECPCLLNQCTGSIDIKLLIGDTPLTRQPLFGRHTSYNFTWIASGDPDDPHELIRDFSIVAEGQ